jgi:hypothetical protein
MQCIQPMNVFKLVVLFYRPVTEFINTGPAKLNLYIVQYIECDQFTPTVQFYQLVIEIKDTGPHS